jgi:aspartyl-tRNA(Asn)/glutamyl-tRNA(Gln) amidotransferase subunit C
LGQPGKLEEPQTLNFKPETAIFVSMEVNDALVDKLANLFVDKLNELNTEGVEPLLHMTDAVNILREDLVKGSITREEGLKNAPDTDGIYFKVPKVINKG